MQLEPWTDRQLEFIGSHPIVLGTASQIFHFKGVGMSDGGIGRLENERDGRGHDEERLTKFSEKVVKWASVRAAFSYLMSYDDHHFRDIFLSTHRLFVK
jgi:hypothetical protein